MTRDDAFTTLVMAFSALNPEQKANLYHNAKSHSRIACGPKRWRIYTTADGYG